MDHPFFTIGHSTRALPEFVALLLEAGVDTVADVRSVPRSRTNPQYNRETLPGSLAQLGIGYVHLAKLGGLRGHRSGDGPSPNGWWENASFRNYADYAMTALFREGLAELRALGSARRVAMMCAEAVWWRCHRRIIADYLLVEGEEVRHLLGPGHVEEAHLTASAREEKAVLVYPP